MRFGVKISLALLFSGQGVLVYGGSCHGAFPHPFPLAHLAIRLSSYEECICLFGLPVRSDSRSCIIKEKIFRMLKIAFDYCIFFFFLVFDRAARSGHMSGCTLLGAF